MLLQWIRAVEEGPEANDVVAGWTGLLLVLAMIAAVAFLGWSLVKQLKKADKAASEGVYDADDSDDGSVPGDSGDTTR